ncbi:hypothetical protein SADUNF_Sadunf14G0125300 [Salix dunnii]|uniref:Uncharacterized protein n=1 Tax=Salix dunnii TaxID=1413687 RepID=A0A835JM71_9ROSI|nr:hypothetical protein SADUNF_Sadunf14G0125300 [Salix dunnii]
MLCLVAATILILDFKHSDFLLDVSLHLILAILKALVDGIGFAAGDDGKPLISVIQVRCGRVKVGRIANYDLKGDIREMLDEGLKA